MQPLVILQYAALFAAVLSVGSVLRQRDTIGTLKESNSALKEESEIQHKKIVELKEETQHCLEIHVVNDKKITFLESRLSTYDDLALVPKDFITKHDLTQTRIVSILERIESNQPNASVVAAKVEQVKQDLRHDSTHIAEQVVDNQIILKESKK